MLALVLVAVALLFGAASHAVAAAATTHSATTTSAAATDTTPATPVAGPSHARPTLSLATVRALAGRSPAIRSWIHDHPVYRVTPQFDPNTHQWTVYYVSRNRAGADVTQAEVLIDDNTAEVQETRTGPQVAWMMARGYWGAFGRHINDPWLWTGLCVAVPRAAHRDPPDHQLAHARSAARS